MIYFFLLALLFSYPLEAAEKAIPYLGPGADKLSKEEYERIYKNYIQTSVLLGYSFLEGSLEPCDQALATIFRQAGFFGYPVPADAQGVQRKVRVDAKAGESIETYELGGMLLQLSRRRDTNSPTRLLWINSGSTKASRRLAVTAKKETLTLEKDKITGLERVKGIPVGFPHPYLNKMGQGLLVKILRFNGQKACQPLEFSDNAWNNGFDLSSDRCRELQNEAVLVWTEKMQPSEFKERELTRMKEKTYRNILAQGVKEAEAKRLVDKHFVPPVTNEINIVGTAMRNLAQCNLMAMGEKARATAPSGGEAGKPSGSTPGSGSAK